MENSNIINNKVFFYLIFLISLIGLISSINTVYNHISSNSNQEELEAQILNQKLVAAENQIRIIAKENSKLIDEIDGLKQQIGELNTSINTSLEITKKS